MGYSVAWLAVPQKSKAETLAALGLEETLDREEMPESPLLGANLTTGWYLVWFDDASPAALKPESLRSISSGTELITCQVEEHAMCSTAAHWIDGTEQWFVVHDSEDGLTNLEIIGGASSFVESKPNTD